eukprot:3964058-Pleurochrysis_carterae.AAC.1
MATAAAALDSVANPHPPSPGSAHGEQGRRALVAGLRRGLVAELCAAGVRAPRARGRGNL